MPRFPNLLSVHVYQWIYPSICHLSLAYLCRRLSVCLCVCLSVHLYFKDGADTLASRETRARTHTRTHFEDDAERRVAGKAEDVGPEQPGGGHAGEGEEDVGKDVVLGEGRGHDLAGRERGMRGIGDIKEKRRGRRYSREKDRKGIFERKREEGKRGRGRRRDGRATEGRTDG